VLAILRPIPRGGRRPIDPGTSIAREQRGDARPEPGIGFGAALRRYREGAGLSQAQLAERAGLSAKAIGALERGERRRPHPQTLDLLATALGLEADERRALVATTLGGVGSPPATSPAALAPPGLVRLLPGRPTPKHNLPLQLTSFVGRERELAEVTRLLGTTRLLTLTGTGGCGKTRLAVEVGATLLDHYPDGVWFVDLAPVADPAFVLQAIASALTISEQPDQPLLATMVQALRNLDVLLILDNCEHLINTCSRLAEGLLRACPRLSVLATSREVLRCAGEVVWHVPSLAVPAPSSLPSEGTSLVAAVSQAEATRLFVTRAAAVRPDFVLVDANARSVAEIAWRLDGIPLALELAAARVSALSPQQIAERLDDRFVLLTAGRRAALLRQQTLLASLDWSHDLLAEPERILFRRVALFAGGFDIAAVEAVCGDVADRRFSLDALTLLIDRSLVQVDNSGGEARYRLLETIRAYAWDRLAESGDLRRIQWRHAEFYVALAQQSERAILQGADQAQWLDRLEREHANFRVALAWAIGVDSDIGLKLALSLVKFWEIRGYLTEGRHWLESALTKQPACTRLRATALREAAQLAHRQVDGPAERRLLAESLALFRDLGDKNGTGAVLLDQGRLAREDTDYQRAKGLIEESLALFHETGDLRRAGWALHQLARLATAQSQGEQAEALFVESLAIARSVGEWSDVAWTLSYLGLHHLDRADRERAQPVLEESLRLFQEIGDRQGTGWAARLLGQLALHTGDYPEADEILREGLEQARAVGDTRGVAGGLRAQADLARLKGNPRQALPLFEESLRLWRELGDRNFIGLVLATMGHAVRLARNPERAKRLAKESLIEVQASRDERAIAHCLWLAGIGALQDGDYDRGVRVIATAESRPRFGWWRYAVDEVDAQRSLASARVALGEAGFAQAWAAGRAMTPEQAIADALAEEDS
jgi:predicted ATPase/transcriptional regulator with XRE-family HTH domain